jgi:type I restriction enzyme R subunit
MTLSESDTRAKLIDPTLHTCGWTEDLIRREETAGAVEILDGQPHRCQHGRTDYTLRVKVTLDAQPVAVALIEAKAEHLPPGHGLEQAKLYAESKRLNVPFVFATNGHLFVRFDRKSGKTAAPRPLVEFPTPADLRTDYEREMGFRLDAPTARPLLARYMGGEATRRYYQDAAIRTVLEKIARGEKRALLSLATGSGKTFIAVHLLKRIADAGQLKRALFICDRDELRSQGLAAFQNVFGADAAEVYRKPDGANNAKNARLHIATYQTLGIDSEAADATFLTENYPKNYFSHIVIDECHRSAWGKWSLVLRRNPEAVQVGLTATPRQLTGPEMTPEDLQITADNLKYFGEPAYEYNMAQGIEDGYLAACEVVRRDIFLDEKERSERETGVERADLKGKRLSSPITGERLSISDVRERRYEANAFEARLMLPDRVRAMCQDLFELLLANGGAEQKSIIFCARDSHADQVAAEMNNLYADWCAAHAQRPLEHYAFKCTAASSGNDQLADLRGSSRSYFIACTVDLLTTGVDVPVVRNVVFFKYVRSAIAFSQMVGRGARLHPPSGKLMFRVYDYTDATRLFGEDFVTRFVKPREGGEEQRPQPASPIQVEGFDVTISDAGQSILAMVDGQAMPVTVEEYKERLAARLVKEAPSLESFRSIWINPPERRRLLDRLPDGARSALLVRSLEKRDAYDLYDVLADLGYGLRPLTRRQRADAFNYKHAAWLGGMPSRSADALRALAGQFARAGTEGLENQLVFETPEVKKSGGLEALRSLGRPADVLRETKARIFAA